MKKRYLIAGLVVLIAFLAYSQRGFIALQVLPGAIEKAMSGNMLNELEDGLHISLCGAGGPMPDPVRSGPCVAVIAGKNLFVVDAGSGGARNLGRLRYPLGDITALFLTHFHSDHIDGLGELAMMRWVNGANISPLPVYGPEGVSRIVDGINDAYARDATYRNDHHGDSVAPLTGMGMKARDIGTPEEGESIVVYDSGGAKVEMILVDHYPVRPAVAYRFSYANRTLLISGDTVKSANIEKFAQDIDLLVHEALAPNLVMIMNAAAQVSGNAGMAKITTDILDYHATPVEAAETARDAGVGHLLYYHIVPPLLLPGSEAVWLAGVDEVFDDYTVGVDGVTISLPANSAEIRLVKSGM
jgi:ribonuclease Z